MRKTMKNLKKKEGFTIVELLTVMSIIIILISILVPAMNKARQFAKEVLQKNQFKAINSGLEMFRNDFDEYPESSYDTSSTVAGTTFAYCGAMKLAEAMMGQDLIGFHPYSRFRSDYKDGQGKLLYDENPIDPIYPDDYNQQFRKGPYLELGNANIHRLWNVYGGGNDGPPQLLPNSEFSTMAFVLCDAYTNVENNSPTGKTYIGMPVLYYRANTTGNGHPHFIGNDPVSGPAGQPAPTPGPTNYYNYLDNDALVQLGMPWLKNPLVGHLMDSTAKLTRYNDPPMNQSNAYFFYHNTYDEDVPLPQGRPHRSDSFILLSAGLDGEYGTSDDITNFPQ
ncbi:MAG: type II secretion system protein [Planctomycetota bacterium]